MQKASLKSPKGIASYPWLNKADTKFDEEGVWKVDLIVDKNDETEAFVDAIKAVAVAEFGKKASKAHMPFGEHEEDDTKIVLKFGTKHAPSLHTGSGKKLNRATAPMVGQGSLLRIMTTAQAWDGNGGKSGVKLYLNAVQIIKLVEYGAADFDAEDEGWEPEMADGEAFGNEETDNVSGGEAADNAAPKDGKGYGF